MIRKNILDELDHWFDPQLNLVEDYDFFMRIMLKHKAEYLNEPLAIYRIHKQNHTTLYRAEFPEEEIYCLEKLKRITGNKVIISKISDRIKERTIEKEVRQLLLRHRYISFLKTLYKNDLLSIAVLFKASLLYIKINIRNII